MAENIIMPQLGESIAEGTIVKWLKNVGDTVQKDENVLLISTDKVEAEIPSPINGILLSIKVNPGETVPVGTILGEVGESGEKGKKATKEAPKEIQKEVPLEEERPKVGKPEKTKEKNKNENKEDLSQFLSPVVKEIAQKNNIKEDEIKNIEGTGRFGRVSKNDILNYIKEKPTKETKTAPFSVPEPSFEPSFTSEREIRKPISTMRRVIMENMLASRRTSAHVTTFFEIDYTAIDNIRKAHKDRFKKEEGISLTYTVFLAAALPNVLKRHPYINATIDKDGIIFKQDVNLGVAVAIDSPEPGLMVPVIKNADKLNLVGMAHAISDLSNRVRTKKIKPDELSGGTFTITNPGNYGAVVATPIINQPQVAILGVGNIKKQPCVITAGGQDMIAIRQMGWLSLSFDHRLVDGATADIFMADLKQALENYADTF